MRKSELLLTLALVAAVVSSLWLWRELEGERARSAELRLSLSHADPRQPAQSKIVVAPPSVPGGQARSDQSDHGAAPAPHAAPAREDDREAYQRRLLSDPKYREAWREQQRTLYARRRGNLIRIVGLTAEQADAVIDLQIDRELGWMENAGNVGASQLQAEETAHQQQLRDLLGEDKRQQLQNYMESRATRMRVDDFRSELGASDALRDDQVEPLIAALHVEDARMRQEMQGYRASLDWDGNASEARRQLGDRELETFKKTYERMHSAAAPVLTSSQLDKLDAMLKRDLDRRTAEQRINRARSQFDQSDASPAKTSSD